METNERPFAEGQRVRVVLSLYPTSVPSGTCGAIVKVLPHGYQVVTDLPDKFEWFFHAENLEDASPIPSVRPFVWSLQVDPTPPRVHAEHSAERYVAKRYDCPASHARSLHRSAYRTAYKAIRQFQKDEARRCS